MENFLRCLSIVSWTRAGSPESRTKPGPWSLHNKCLLKEVSNLYVYQDLKKKKKEKLQGAFRLRKITLGLPWWYSGLEPASQCRRHRFDPWSGKIPHVSEQLSPVLRLPSPRAATPEACTLQPVPSSTGSHRIEKAMHHNEE